MKIGKSKKPKSQPAPQPAEEMDMFQQIEARKPYQTIMASLIFYMKSSHRKHYIPENLTDFEWELFAQGALEWFLADHSHLIHSVGLSSEYHLDESIAAAKRMHDEA
jgi:hypothetical protein